jgi:hypothetical protein
MTTRKPTEQFPEVGTPERRAKMAELCAEASDEDLAVQLVGTIEAMQKTPGGSVGRVLVVLQTAEIIRDIRAGERLRLNRESDDESARQLARICGGKP